MCVCVCVCVSGMWGAPCEQGGVRGRRVGVGERLGKGVGRSAFGVTPLCSAFVTRAQD
jgi:hypothetical protein